MSKLKRPLQALLIASDIEMREAILNEDKKITIRKGYRDYQEGFVLLACPTDPWCVGADIVDVRYCLLKEINEEEYKADGFTDYEHLLGGMRNYYPDINGESEMTVIKWDNIRGKLVDDYRIGNTLHKVK